MVPRPAWKAARRSRDATVSVHEEILVAIAPSCRKIRTKPSKSVRFVDEIIMVNRYFETVYDQPPPSLAPQVLARRILAVVPVLNEAAGIEPCLRSLLTGDRALRAIDLVLTDDRSEEQDAVLQRYFRTRHSPQMRALSDQIAKLQQEEQQTAAMLPTTLVMQERDEPMAAGSAA